MEFLGQMRDLLISIGPPGLLGLSLVDSAGLPTGGGPDLALMLLARYARGWEGATALVLAAVLGSTLGCLLLYGLGRRGGRRALERFELRRRQWVQDKIERYGFWALLLSVLGPPPYPTKLFVLTAGVFRMRLLPLVCAVVLGRALRYSMAGYLGFVHGERAGELLKAHYPLVFLGLLALVALILLLRWGWKRSHPEQRTTTPLP